MHFPILSGVSEWSWKETILFKKVSKNTSSQSIRWFNVWIAKKKLMLYRDKLRISLEVCHRYSLWTFSSLMMKERSWRRTFRSQLRSTSNNLHGKINRLISKWLYQSTNCLPPLLLTPKKLTTCLTTQSSRRSTNLQAKTSGTFSKREYTSKLKEAKPWMSSSRSFYSIELKMMT